MLGFIIEFDKKVNPLCACRELVLTICSVSKLCLRFMELCCNDYFFANISKFFLSKKHVVLEPEVLQQMLSEGHVLTRLNFKGLTEAQLIAPIGASYNPLCWGVGHVSYFYETNAYKLLKPNAKQVYLDIDLDVTCFFKQLQGHVEI